MAVPRYDFRCRACGATFEVSRPMADADSLQHRVALLQGFRSASASQQERQGHVFIGAKRRNQIEKLKLVPVFVRDVAGAPEGNKRLLKRGALAFPQPPWKETLQEELARAAEAARSSSSPTAPIQPSLL